MKNKKNIVIISNLDSHINELGVLNYCNSLMLNKYKRFYIINHPNTKAVRAWQAHPLEGKCFIPIKGKFVISWVEIDDFITDDLMIGIIRNDLVGNQPYTFNDKIFMKMEHIIMIEHLKSEKGRGLFSEERNEN